MTAGAATADLGANRTPARQHPAGLLDAVGLEQGRLALRGDRFGAGLDDVQLAIETVLGLLDVHRPPCSGHAAVVILDLDRRP